MLLNTKCERCNEPTKHVVGFWDGENGKSGFVHDCENENPESEQPKKNVRRVHSSITERRKNIDDGNVKDCRLQSG